MPKKTFRVDLSKDAITNVERLRLRGEIEEERERRWWKTRLLWASAAAIILFYGVFLWFVFCAIPRDRIEHVHVFMAAVLAAVPTLLAINFLKLVRYRDSSEKEDVESSPWFALFRELVDILKTK